MTTTRSIVRTGRPVIALGILALALSGCTTAISADEPAPKPSNVRDSAAPSPSRDAVVAGYDVGQFPPVPLFVLPDLALLDQSAPAFTIALRTDLQDIPGVRLAAAPCDAAGGIASAHGTAYLYGDGSGAFIGPDGTVQNFGDGSGSSSINGVTIQNFGDGSGAYTDGTVSIQNFGDGAGTYTDAEIEVQIFGDGGGTYRAGDVLVQNFGDGAGEYVDGTTRIQNFGDGAGTYTAPDLTIQNLGDGTALVNGERVQAAPLPPVPRLGVFPPLGALTPLESCGITLTFEDGVLFDFDRSDIRPDAAATLDAVAAVFTDLAVPRAEVGGHTDAVGSDEENQQLSEDRADAVVMALTERGVATSMTASGFGEQHPVAANEIDGVDNPAGRQLNRRVEIFIPAS